MFFRITFFKDGKDTIFVLNEGCEGYNSFEGLVKAASTPHTTCVMGQETTVGSSDNNNDDNNNSNNVLPDLKDFLSSPSGPPPEGLSEMNDPYHGELDAEGAKELVCSYRDPGYFLIRKSNKNRWVLAITSLCNEGDVFHDNFRVTCMKGQLYFIHASVFYHTWEEMLTAMRYGCNARLDIFIRGPYYKPPPRRKLKWPEGWLGPSRSAGKSADDSDDDSMRDF
jgi:hypothetical protein